MVDYALFMKIWKRDGGTCQNCGNKVRKDIAVRPKKTYRGGELNEENLEVLCLPCFFKT